MSNYVKIVNYAAKDGLTTGDPNKKILGAQLDAEYTAIATAITSKEDVTNRGIANGYAPLDANGDVNALGVVVTGAVVPTNGVYLPGANTIGLSTNGTLKLSINANGTVTVAQPAAGNPAAILSTVSGGATETLRLLSGATADSPYQVFSRIGTLDGYIGSVGTAGNLLTSSSVGDVVLRGDTAGILLGSNANGIVLKVTSGGAIQGKGPVNTGLVDMTPDTGTFVGTITGCTTAPTATFSWSRNGNQVTLFMPLLNATSNSTSCTFTGLPAAIQPTRPLQSCPVGMFANNSIAVANVIAQLASGSGTITFLMATSATAFTAAGSKGTSGGCTITYLLN